MSAEWLVVEPNGWCVELVCRVNRLIGVPYSLQCLCLPEETEDKPRKDSHRGKPEDFYGSWS